MGYRICTVCKTKMEEGYLHEELSKYFCKDECLDATFPGQSDIQANMSEEDLEDAVLYWTAWEDANDIIPVEPDEVLKEVNALYYVKSITYWFDKSTPGNFDTVVEVEGSNRPWSELATTRYLIGEWEKPSEALETVQNFLEEVPTKFKDITKEVKNEFNEFRFCL